MIDVQLIHDTHSAKTLNAVLLYVALIIRVYILRC